MYDKSNFWLCLKHWKFEIHSYNLLFKKQKFFLTQLNIYIASLTFLHLIYIFDIVMYCCRVFYFTFVHELNMINCITAEDIGVLEIFLVFPLSWESYTSNFFACRGLSLFKLPKDIK